MTSIHDGWDQEIYQVRWTNLDVPGFFSGFFFQTWRWLFFKIVVSHHHWAKATNIMYLVIISLGILRSSLVIANLGYYDYVVFWITPKAYFVGVLLHPIGHPHPVLVEKAHFLIGISVHTPLFEGL